MDKDLFEYPSKDRFFEQLNTTFLAHAEGGEPFDIQLVNAESKISNSIQDAFSLIFRAPADVEPFQNNFNVTHASLGTMDIFLVPVSRDEDGLYFEAVFNRLLV